MCNYTHFQPVILDDNTFELLVKDIHDYKNRGNLFLIQCHLVVISRNNLAYNKYMWLSRRELHCKLAITIILLRRCTLLVIIQFVLPTSHRVILMVTRDIILIKHV